jgi:hypothetical protein
LLEEGFEDRCMKNWSGNKSRFSDQNYALHIWHECLRLLRQYLRGWNANRIKESKAIKKELLSRLEQLDEIDLGHPKGGGPGRRDISWKQNWNKFTMRRRYFGSRGVLKSGYSWRCQHKFFFHASANGRKRKTMICSLEAGSEIISDKKEISLHIVQFYKNLFGAGVFIWQRVFGAGKNN